MVRDKDIYEYEGIPEKTAERWKKESEINYDPELVAESRRRTEKMSKEKWKTVQSQGDEITRGLAAITDRDPSAPEVQKLISGHHAWIENFYTCNAEVYKGLAKLYVLNDEFRTFYDKFSENMADFMAAAMTHYADTILADK